MEQDKQEIYNNDKIIRITIGASFGAMFAILLVLGIMSRACRRRQYTTVRRWEPMDLDYGKKLFMPGKDENEPENDFEIDMADMSTQTRKLLNNK